MITCLSEDNNTVCRAKRHSYVQHSTRTFMRRRLAKRRLYYKVPIKRDFVGDGGKRDIRQLSAPREAYVCTCATSTRESAARLRVRGYSEIDGGGRWRGALCETRRWNFARAAHTHTHTGSSAGVRKEKKLRTWRIGHDLCSS